MLRLVFPPWRGVTMINQMHPFGADKNAKHTLSAVLKTKRTLGGAWRGGDGVAVAMAVMGWCGDRQHGSGDGVGWKVVGISPKRRRKMGEYAFSDSLLLTPLCCDDIHDVTSRVSALAGCDRLVAMSPPIRRKYRDSVAFTTRCRKIKNCKWKQCTRKIRIPIGMWPCRVEEKMTLKEVDGKMVEEIETR
ncbi:hypothetical protein Tco_0642568 [Tanacetum coccineum]